MYLRFPEFFSFRAHHSESANLEELFPCSRSDSIRVMPFDNALIEGLNMKFLLCQI